MKNKKLKTINDPVCLMIMKGTNIIINWWHLFSSRILHHIIENSDKRLLPLRLNRPVGPISIFYKVY